MPTFDIVKTVQPEKTFRVAAIMGKFDLQSEKITETFTGEIDLPVDWQVGLIVGKSGSGKTTIAEKLFPDNLITSYEYGAETILDDMPKDCTVEQISKAFNAVGFSSPPSWLKPYEVLSNGQKMRVDLARAILEDQNLFVFDEFTSVVDRKVAEIGSFAIQKAVRKTEKQFIAVTCHYDVQDWLLPDWVFNTDTMTFTDLTDQKKNRPDIRFEVFKAKDKSIWRVFARHHYLNHSHNNAASVYVAYVNDELAGFYSVLPFPHPHKKNTFKGHRLVILPDFQGLGIGLLLRTEIAKYYSEQLKKTFIATTSHPAIIHGLQKHPNWRITRVGRTSLGSSQGKIQNKNKRGSTSSARITTSWEYIPN